MPGEPMLKVGAIGYRNHAARMIDIVNNSKIAKVDVVYHPTKKGEGYQFTDRLDDLLKYDVVLILSPNDTHYDYLTFLNENFDGYVFCEKPPVSNLEQLEAIEVDSGKVFFNFNMRFSPLREHLEAELNSGSLGAVIKAEAIISHGLAFKESYLDSWRSDNKKHPLGVAETVSVHYIDLFSLLFGKIVHIDQKMSIFSERETACDTSHTVLKHEQGTISNILTSYAAPVIERVFVMGTNGYLVYENGTLSKYAPRDTFDEKGFFASPPLVYSETIKKGRSDNTSLENSLSYFLDFCRKKEKFPKELCQLSISTNRLLLSLGNN